MASYLVDLILLSALLFTSIRVTKMHRELVRLRADQGDFTFVLGKTTDTVDNMVVMVREFSADGKQLVNVLGDKIEEARKAIMDIEAQSDASRAYVREEIAFIDSDRKRLNADVPALSHG
jgi:hypothetical protein